MNIADGDWREDLEPRPKRESPPKARAEAV